MVLPKPKTLLLAYIGWLVLLAAAPAAIPASKPAVLCTLQPGQTRLAAGTRHGLAQHLAQYPDVSLPSPGERRAAVRLLERVRKSTARWADVKAAAASGFDTDRARRAPGDDLVGYLHAEHRRFSADHRILDPRRPEALIYATEPGRRPRLVGAMFSMRRGVRGPTPGGAIDRWHAHVVCVKGVKRGLAPRRDGRCPAGARRAQGSEMLHVWFTADLRSAFAVHAPVPQLCRDGLLSAQACLSGAHRLEM